MGLRAYILKRTIYMLFLLFFVITVNFLIFAAMPGNPIMVFAGSLKLQEETQYNELMARWGLDLPLHERYVKYVSNMLTFNFGRSYFGGKPVAVEIQEKLLNTFLLTGTSTVLSIVIGVILGVIAASKRGRIFDTVSVISSLMTYSLPSFWMGMIFIIIFYFHLGWFPVGHTFPRDWAIHGWPQPIHLFGNIYFPSMAEILGRLYHLFLPAFTLTIFLYGGYLLLTRATMLEVLTEDYIVTARAKGLKERTVLFKHALKNASLPIITSVALSFGFLLTGAIITEQVFSWPGLGMWIWDAIEHTDYPSLQTIFYVIALCVIVANFIADILYGVIDPRIKYG